MMTRVTLGELLQKCTALLSQRSGASWDPSREAWLLVGRVLGFSPAECVRLSQDPLHALFPSWEDPQEHLLRLAKQRVAGVPLAYLTHYVPFFDHLFFVHPFVFIPRPETEELVELLLKETHEKEACRVAELGAGTGNIGISALLNRPLWEWHAWEKSQTAVRCAKLNQVRLLNPGHHYHVAQGDFFSESPSAPSFDWVVSNPPYVPTSQLSQLNHEVQFEPPLALDGGRYGFELPEKLIRFSLSLLRPGGRILLEVDATQGPLLQDLAQELGLRYALFPDLSNKTRFFLANAPSDH